MSARYFCDRCGHELDHKDHDRLRREIDNIAVEVMHRNDGTWNKGHVCHKCIVDCVLNGTDL